MSFNRLTGGLLLTTPGIALVSMRLTMDPGIRLQEALQL